MAALRRWQAVGGKKWMDKLCHSTLPFENLRVLSPSAVSSGPNGIVEGLMALSKIEGLVSTLGEPHVVLERTSSRSC